MCVPRPPSCGGDVLTDSQSPASDGWIWQHSPALVFSLAIDLTTCELEFAVASRHQLEMNESDPLLSFL
jgi:hypothetical protein